MLQPARLVCLYDFGFGDDYGLNRHVVVVAVAFGGHAFDGINNILAFHHFAEYGVAPAVQAWGGGPRWGVTGAAVASSVAYSGMLTFSIVVFLRITGTKAMELLPDPVSIVRQIRARRQG